MKKTEDECLKAGLHILMDGYVVDSSVFTQEKIKHLFARLVSALEMKMLDVPRMYEVPVDPEILRRVKETGKFEDEGGITGFCIISTSHMSVHCWPLQNFFSLDAFSCKDFDSALALDIIRYELGVSTESTEVKVRFRPHSPEISLQSQ